MATQRIKTGLIQVDGVTELNKALSDFGDEFKGEMRRTFKGIADFVAADAKGAAFAAGSTLAKVAPSIKASAGATSAGVALGGPAFPMAGGAEFGGQRTPTTQQFQPWRGNGADAGYALYPSIRRDAGRIETAAAAGLDQLIKKAGLA